MLNQAATCLLGLDNPGTKVYVANTVHPVSPKVLQAVRPLLHLRAMRIVVTPVCSTSQGEAKGH